MKQQAKGRRGWLVAEALVIVSSILLAFTLDAWWDQAASRSDLRQDLENVAAEIEGNRDRLLFQIDFMERMTSAGDSLLSVMEAAQEGSLISTPDTVLWLINNYPTFNPSLGAVEAMIASGRLAAIGEPSLRRGLAGLHDRIADAVEEQTKALTIYYDHVLPIVAEESNWPSRAEQEGNDSFWTGDRLPGRALNTSGPVQIPVRRAWIIFQGERLDQYRISASEMRALLAVLDGLKTTIGSVR